MRRTIYIPSQIAFPQRKCILLFSSGATISRKTFHFQLVHHESSPPSVPVSARWTMECYSLDDAEDSMVGIVYP